MEVIKTDIEGLVIIEPKIFRDSRGYFFESFSQREFEEKVRKVNFVQDNFSRSAKGVLRGLHFQTAPFSQAKLVRCGKGRIYDIVVDIRKDSSTYGEYIRVELSEDNKNMLFIPEGVAHGFVVLSDVAEICYKVSREYNQQADSGILWNDPDLAIDWGIDFDPILSEKDTKLPRLKDLN